MARSVGQEAAQVEGGWGKHAWRAERGLGVAGAAIWQPAKPARISGTWHIDGHLHRAQHEAGRPPSFRGCGSATGPSAHAPGPWGALAGPSGATAASAMFWNPRLRTSQKNWRGGCCGPGGPLGPQRLPKGPGTVLAAPKKIPRPAIEKTALSYILFFSMMIVLEQQLSTPILTQSAHLMSDSEHCITL